MILNNEGKKKPIWITKFVFPTSGNKDFLYSEENPASVLTRYLALMFVNGIEKALIFNLKDEAVAENAETSEKKQAWIETVLNFAPSAISAVINHWVLGSAPYVFTLWV